MLVELVSVLLVLSIKDFGVAASGGGGGGFDGSASTVGSIGAGQAGYVYIWY